MVRKQSLTLEEIFFDDIKNNNFLQELQKEGINADLFKRYAINRLKKLKNNETIDKYRLKADYIQLEKKRAAKTAQRDLYFKASLDEKVLASLKEEKIDIEDFKRYVKKCEFKLKDKEVLDLSQVKADYLALQKRMMQELNTPEKLAPAHLRIANERADKIRKAAAAARAKAQAYSGKLPDNKAAADAVIDMLQAEASQISLGLKPADYVQKTTSEFIEKLELLSSGRKIAMNEVKVLASAFEKHTTALQSNQITYIDYLDLCKKDLEASAKILSKPLTFWETAYHVVMTATRTLLNVFNQLYSWLLSTELTKTKDYQSFSPTQQAALAHAVSSTSINNDFSNLKNEVKQSEDRLTAAAEKTAKRAERTAEVAKGESPYQEKIKTAKEVALKKADELAAEKQARIEAHELRRIKLKEEKLEILKQRKENYRQYIISIFRSQPQQVSREQPAEEPQTDSTKTAPSHII